MTTEFKQLFDRIEAAKATAKAKPPKSGVNAPLPTSDDVEACCGKPAGGLLRDLTDLQCLAGSRWTDADKVRTAVEQINASVPDGHPRHQQLADAIAERPIDISSREAFEAWVVWLHNRTNRFRGLPTLTVEQAREVRPLATNIAGAGGIGDTIVALYAACGLAKATGRRVVYYTRHREWIGRATFPGVLVRDHREIGVDASGEWHGRNGYHDATRNAPSRLWAYCTNLAGAYGVPAFEGVRPNVNRHIHKPRADGRYAVLAPFTSAWPARQWPAEKWTELARALADRGIRPIGIGASDQADRLTQALPGHEYRYGVSPAEIMDLMLGAEVTVGNDSGVAHVGGLLDVPTVAVHAGSLPHGYLFACAPSVRSVMAGSLPRSDANAAALARMPVDDVLAVVDSAVRQFGDRFKGERTEFFDGFAAA